MKKILIFSLNYYPKFIGGAEVAIKEITNRIPQSDFSFDLVTLRFDATLPRVEKIGNTTIYRIGFTKINPSIGDLGKFPLHLNKLFYQFLAPWEAHKLHKKNNYDAVWAMMAHSTGVPGALFKIFHPRVAYILTLQEGDPIPYIKRKMLPLYPLFMRAFTKADIIQTISTFLLKWGKDMGATCPIEVIPNAVNTKHFSQEFSKEIIETYKNKIGKKENDVYLVTTSRLVMKNACDDVIKALPLLPENVSFIIMGIGPDEMMLRVLAKELGVSDRVKFLGQIGHDEMPKYLKACDIFIRPSLSEGMGNSFVEAMAGGLPVIATQEGGIADFLFDAQKNKNKAPTGWAVNPRDPISIARQVKKILDNKEERMSTVTNARKLAFEKYDWDLIARDMREKVFARVVK